MKQRGLIDSSHIPESIPYIIQNLRAVYGNPRPERGLDPLDVLIETILSQSTSKHKQRPRLREFEEAIPDLGTGAARASDFNRSRDPFRRTRAAEGGKDQEPA